MKKLKSWLPNESDSDFSIYNLPFGIFSIGDKKKRIGVAIGDKIIDLSELAKLGHFQDIIDSQEVFNSAYLNDFIALGKPITNKVRDLIQKWLCDSESVLAINPRLFVEQKSATMHLPVKVNDYTDFYSSIEHATNVGVMFRDPENALLPNWKHIPVGYHGRASSIIESGINITRPKGQIKPVGSGPIFSPSQRLDFELEMAFIVGKATSMGTSISTDQGLDYIFGMVLFNDWSARDIQKWEYVPLGPFLSKSFASSISPWVVTMEALKPFALKGPVQEPKVLPYLQYEGEHNYNIDLEVSIQPDGGSEQVICKSNYKYMYWNMAQQLAHHTINGCNVNIGDMMASGTISGPTPDSYGSMLELSWAGSNPIALNDGSERKFINDGDTVTMRGHGQKDNIRVGFGEVRSTILPAT